MALVYAYNVLQFWPHEIHKSTITNRIEKAQCVLLGQYKSLLSLITTLITSPLYADSPAT